MSTDLSFVPSDPLAPVYPQGLGKPAGASRTGRPRLGAQGMVIILVGIVVFLVLVGAITKDRSDKDDSPASLPEQMSR